MSDSEVDGTRVDQKPSVHDKERCVELWGAVVGDCIVRQDTIRREECGRDDALYLWREDPRHP